MSIEDDRRLGWPVPDDPSSDVPSVILDRNMEKIYRELGREEKKLKDDQVRQIAWEARISEEKVRYKWDAFLLVKMNRSAGAAKAKITRTAKADAAREASEINQLRRDAEAGRRQAAESAQHNAGRNVPGIALPDPAEPESAQQILNLIQREPTSEATPQQALPPPTGGTIIRIRVPVELLRKKENELEKRRAELLRLQEGDLEHYGSL